MTNTKIEYTSEQVATFATRINTLRSNCTRLKTNFENEGGDPKKAGKNIESMLEPLGKFAFTIATSVEIDKTAKQNAHGVEYIFAQTTNPKKPYRFVQLVNGTLSGKYEDIDLTTVRGIYALYGAPGETLNRDALENLLTGKVKVSGMIPNTKGVGLSRLDAIMGRVGAGSSQSQVSRSFASEGFCTVLSMCKTASGSNAEITLNLFSPIVKSIMKMIDTATDAQLERMVEASRK